MACIVFDVSSIIYKPDAAFKRENKTVFILGATLIYIAGIITVSLMWPTKV